MTGNMIGLRTAELDELIARAPAHLRGILRVTRDTRAVFFHVVQDSGRFQAPPRDRPFVAIIGDDMVTTKGPTAFHAKSLRKLFGLADVVLINSSTADPRFYNYVANVAAIGGRAILIETRAGPVETSWFEFTHKHAPLAARVMVATPHAAFYGAAAGTA